MNNEIKEKDIIQKSIECLSNAKLNDTTYEVARDIVLDYITNLQERIFKARKMIFDNYGLLDKYEVELLDDILKGEDNE